jgi:D-beta-D-heptose 7-phosphate kinase/D-beta-D-heptose 1-phosphate adenosyltransferase
MLETIKNKIFESNALLKQINAWRLKGNVIVFTNGCFDILHPGHVSYLAQAKALGHRLIIGLNTDASVKRLKGASRPINNENDRALIIASLAQVDAVIMFDEDTPLSLIQFLKPDTLVKGGDYSKEQVVGAEFVKNNGGQTVILPFLEGYSTTSIIERSKS